jgi:hypothetical protein
MMHVPRIKSAAAIGPTELLVRFDDGSERIHECAPLLERPQFQLLRTPAFSRAVRVDPSGYGISWNDEIDVGESDIWINGKPVGNESHSPPAHRRDRS